MIPKQLQDKTINFVLLKEKEKIPFQTNWQKKKIMYSDVELVEHLNSGGNYGVIGGGKKNLIIVDFDSEEVQNKIIDKLPKTFTVKTGSGLLHKYFFSSDNKSFKIFSKEMDTFADIQGKGKQVVGAGSTHPNGNKYEIFDDSKIAFIDYSELKALIIVYDEKPKKEIKEQIPKKYEGNDFLEKVKSSLSLSSVLSDFGIDTSKNPTNCPLHSSKGGKCLGFDDETWHCFHCEERGNIFTAVTKFKGCGFKEALEYLVDKAGLRKEYEEQKKKYSEENKIEKQIANHLSKTDLSKDILQIQPLYYDKYRIWWMWDKLKFKWKVVDETDILNLVRENSLNNTVNSKEKAEIIEALKQESRLRKPKPTKDTWIQFKDVIVDISTGDEMKASAEFFVTNPIPYPLHKERFVETPIMDKIFEEWVGKKYVKILYEILAYCLIPSYPLNRIFCFLGAGMNGKSKYLELLRKFIGTENCCSTELDTLLNSRFEVTRLHKKLVCQMGETNFNEMSKTSILKKLSGGDLIGFEYKRKDPFEENNYAKIMIATNNLPATTDKTIGFYRRWTLIDFPNQFSEKKDILKDIPEEEYESLAVKCLSILKDLLTERKFTNEGGIEDRMKKYEEKSNPLNKFWKDCINEEYDSYIFRFELTKRINEWCKEHNLREITERVVNKFMKEQGIREGRKYPEWETKDGSKPFLRTWEGIKWK